tara:strand:- start:544 stop:1122 length:579 start_codon:yes stop_codon:yes gene_type:complete
MRFLVILLLSILQTNFLFTQDVNNSTYFKIEGDSIFKKEINLDEVIIYKSVKFSDNKERLDYFVLKRKVLKVYPYAKLASERLEKLNSRLDKIKSKRKKKKYTKMLEKFVQNELTSELKKLTRTEGQILVKLIFRETGVSAYSLVRELRNGFRAFTYNTVARVFNISLKEKYDPLNVREDLFIEDILRNSSM